MSDKELVLDAVQKMPQQVSLAEILDELALMATVKERLAKSETGPGGVPHEDVVKMLNTWITK
jgi:hypothetical protein